MSSEALERAADSVREALADADCECASEHWDAFAVLLAEVARLERYWQESIDAQNALERSEAAVAVAREREQRLREAVTAYLAELDAGRIADDDAIRGALVDEPAAATLAEPEAGADKGATASAVSGSVRTPSGFASAAADEPPQWWPNNETGGAQTTPFPAGGNAGVAADEPGETP